MNNKDLLDKTCITNSPSILGGGYCISAEQLNPDIEGTLRSDINKLNIVLDFYTPKTFYVLPGTNCWAKIATIKVTDSYANTPICFDLSRRGSRDLYHITLLFLNSGNLDPDINVFGCNISTTTIYLYKREVSTWDLYIHKSEAYDNISIVKYYYDYEYLGRKIKINFFTQGEYCKDSDLPDGGIYPTLI